MLQQRVMCTLHMAARLLQCMMFIRLRDVCVHRALAAPVAAVPAVYEVHNV